MYPSPSMGSGLRRRASSKRLSSEPAVPRWAQPSARRSWHLRIEVMARKVAMSFMSTKQQSTPSVQISSKAQGDACADGALAQQILDSLTANVALIDQTGVIITANATWMKFA